jgi:parvulin-like peptidyl-prolyl isomerase
MIVWLERKETIMMKRLILTCMASVVVISLACSKSEDKVAARIGEDVITVGDLKGQYLAISLEARPMLQSLEEKEQFAKDVVSKEVLLMEARKAGFDRMPEIMESVQNEIRQRAWQAYYEDKVRSQVKVTDEDLRALYSKQRYRYHLAWIFLRSGKLAEEISARIKAGEDFADLAATYSLDASKARGGDIGMRALGTMPGHVEDVIMQMSAGKVSEPISYDGYYVLVKLHEKEQMEQQDFETARTGLMSMERMRRESELHRNLASELREEYGLTFNEDVVGMIASKTREFHESGDVEPGQLPPFSDEELARTVASYRGGEWNVRKYLEGIKRQRGFVAPGPGTDAETVKSVISDFINGELWMVELSGEGYENSPEVMQGAERAQEEMVVTAMHNDVVKDVRVDDEKLREFYEENKEDLMTEPGAKLAFIFLATEEDAESAHEALEAGGDFGALAKERSIDEATGPRGGELGGPLTGRQLAQFPELDELVETLSEGAYSRPMPVPPGFGPDGFMVVKIQDKIEARQMGFDEIRKSLYDRVLQLEQEKAFGEWLRDKMVEHQVEVYPDVLGSIDFEDLRQQED